MTVKEIEKLKELLQENSVTMVQASGPYSTIFVDEKSWSVCGTLKYLQPILGEDYVRASRKYLVRKDTIENVIKENLSITVLLKNGLKIPIDRRQKKKFLNAIMQPK